MDIKNVNETLILSVCGQGTTVQYTLFIYMIIVYQYAVINRLKFR